jgi:isopenicillin-N N-acyltransferase like protein
MMRTCLIKLVIVFVIIAGAVNAQESPSTERVPLVELAGTPYERGLQHGKQLQKEINEVFGKWKANTGRYPIRTANLRLTRPVGIPGVFF